jgi:hypothetical protein
LIQKSIPTDSIIAHFSWWAGWVTPRVTAIRRTSSLVSSLAALCADPTFSAAIARVQTRAIQVLLKTNGPCAFGRVINRLKSLLRAILS